MKLDMTNSQPALRQLELQDNDVLCTKDKTLLNHPGNCFFRAHIEKMLPTYKRATSKLEKMNITKMIVDELQMIHNIRFVKFSEETASWEEVDGFVAREKVGHAIRFAIQREKKQALKADKKKKASLIRKTQKESYNADSDSSSDESTGVLDNSDRDTMEPVPTCSSSSPERKTSSSNMKISDLPRLTNIDLEPMDESESSSFVWTKEDFHFLLNETCLFQQQDDMNTMNASLFTFRR